MAGQLTGLHAKFTGDSSSFVKASTLATMALRKQEAEARKAKAAQDALAASGVGLSREFHKLKMETDNAYAGMVRFQKASELAKKVADSQKWSQEQLGAELSRLANHYGVAEAAGLSLNQQIRSSRFHTANLAAQFNDIGVMMASGQSPFIMAIQQGTQINQVMDNMGGTAKEKFKALGASLLSLINPTSILTIGLIAGAAALVQWGMAATGAEAKNEALKKKQEQLKETTEGLIAVTNKLTEARRMAASGIQVAEQQRAVDEIAALNKEKAVIQAEIAKLSSVTGIAERYVGGAQGRSAIQQAEKQARIDEIDGLLKRLEYEQQLEIAQRRRTNEYGDRLREAFEAQQKINLAQEQQAIKAAYTKNVFHMLAGEYAAVSMYSEQVVEGTERNKAAMIGAYQLYAKTRTEANKLVTEAVAAGLAASKLSLVDFGNIDAGAAAALTMAGNLGIAYNAAVALSGVFSRLNAGDDERGSQRSTVRGANTRDVNQPWLEDYTRGGWITPDGAGGGKGGGGGTDPLIKELESLQNELMTKEQLELESYERRQETLNEALEKKLITQQEYSALMEQVEATHNFAMLQSTRDGVSASLSALGQLFQGSKKIGAGIALANSWLAFTEVLKDPSYVGRPWARFAAATSALASGLNAVRNIKSSSPGGGGSSSAGGGTGSGSSGGGQSYSQQVALQLVGGDMFSRDQVLKLINAINEASKDGARITVR